MHGPLAREAVEQLQHRREEVVAGRDGSLRAEGADLGCGHSQAQASHAAGHVVVGRRAARVGGGLGLAVQLALEQVGLVEGVVERAVGLFLKRLAVPCADEVVVEHHRRHAVEDDVVGVAHQIDLVTVGVYRAADQRFLQQVEGAHEALEESGVGPAVEACYLDLDLCVVVTQLHHVGAAHRHACLEAGMRVYHLEHGLAETSGVGAVGKPERLRDVILQGVAVHLPVDVDSTLVLS